MEAIESTEAFLNDDQVFDWHAFVNDCFTLKEKLGRQH